MAAARSIFQSLKRSRSFSGSNALATSSAAGLEQQPESDGSSIRQDHVRGADAVRFEYDEHRMREHAIAKCDLYRRPSLSGLGCDVGDDCVISVQTMPNPLNR